MANRKKHGAVRKGRRVDGSLGDSDLILVRKIHIKETPGFFRGLRNCIDKRKCPQNKMEPT